MSSSRLKNNELQDKQHDSSSSFDLAINTAPSDTNSEQYDNNNVFNIKINSSEFYSKLSKKNKILNFLNKTRFELVGVVDSAAPAYLFGQILPPLPAPYHLMMCTANFVINHKIGSVLGALITQHDPLSKLRADGGSVGRGLLKKSIKHINALTTVLFAGCGISTLLMQDVKLRETLDQAISFNHPIVFVPILGLSGLLIDRLSLKAWNYCWPVKKESLVNHEINLLQEFSQYATSYFHAYTWDIMLTQLLMAAGAKGEIWNPSIVMLRMMSCYVLRESAKYKYHPDSISLPEKYEIKSFHPDMSEEMEVIEEVRPNRCHGMYRMGMFGGLTLLLLICSYFINLYAIDEGLCNEDNLAENTKCSLAVLGTVLLAEFIIKSLTPKICRMHSFFGKSQKEEVNPLLDITNITDVEFETTNNNIKK
jgi:hypothetical protein